MSQLGYFDRDAPPFGTPPKPRREPDGGCERRTHPSRQSCPAGDGNRVPIAPDVAARKFGERRAPQTRCLGFTASEGSVFAAYGRMNPKYMESMKTVSISVAILAVVLIALILVPAASDYRAVLTVAALVAAVVVVATLLIGDGQKSQVPVARIEPVAPEPMKSAPPPVVQNQAEAEVVSLLASLQQKGRFVDFVMDDIAAYTDAQVGAVARVVQDGCKAVLKEQFQISPVREENEGSTVTVAPGYRADEYRLVGKISGQAPFAGTLMHRGWKTESVKLPRIVRTADNRLPTIAPAEVELK
jgi:hypothetical protein